MLTLNVDITGYVAHLNGAPLERLDREESTRKLHLDVANRLIVKVDTGGECQSWNEWVFWTEVVEASDRKYFIPTLAGDLYGGGSWSVMPYVSFGDIVRYDTPDWHELRGVCNKYGLCDGPQARRHAETGAPLIYDYGFAGDGYGIDFPVPSRLRPSGRNS